jgi:hypothetical protein
LNLAIGRQWFKFNVLVIELYLEVPNFPVHVPFFHPGETPGFGALAIVTVHFDESIVGDSD